MLKVRSLIETLGYYGISKPRLLPNTFLIERCWILASHTYPEIDPWVFKFKVSLLTISPTCNKKEKKIKSLFERERERERESTRGRFSLSKFLTSFQSLCIGPSSNFILVNDRWQWIYMWLCTSFFLSKFAAFKKIKWN